MKYIELIEYIVKAIVNEPGAVKIKEGTENDNLTYYINVAQPDVGKVIGKQGNVISAIRLIINATASKESQKVFVKVVAD